MATDLARVAAAFDSVGKAAAGVASLAGFAYLLALGVEIIRLRDARLPSVEVAAILPRDQLLAAGVLELAITLVVALALVGLAQLFVTIRRRATGAWRGVAVVGLGLPLLAVAALLPFAVAGAAWLVAIAVVAVVSATLRPPVWIVIAGALAGALVLTAARQAEFPSPFPTATITLRPAGGTRAPVTISGKYLGSSADDLLIGVRDVDVDSIQTRVKSLAQGGGAVRIERSSVVSVPRDRVLGLVLESASAADPRRSLLSRLGVVDWTCLLPTCRLGGRSVETPL